MEFCPVCKSEIQPDDASCPVCASDLSDREYDWITLGFIDDKISADYALETLRSYDIPSVVFSRSGFFGAVGLPLNPIYKSGSANFEVMVPSESREEANEILNMVLGNSFKPED